MRRRRVLKVLGLTAGAVVLLLAGFLGVGYAVTKVPPPNEIASAQGSRIRYADGSDMGRVGTNRTLVPLSRVAGSVQKAVLAAEDRNFYTEPGISVKGIARAFVTNLKGGGVSQGGSTITQQYAKNVYLTQQRTFTRKIKEIFISLKLSRSVSKDQVLEDYLNTIYFGRGANGIEAAAETYFATSAARLTVAQSAVLAASIRSPAGYDPARHPVRAKERWNYVLDGMVKKGWLSAGERAGLTYPPVLPLGHLSNGFTGPTDYIREQVLAELAKKGYSEDAVAAGGYTIVTTISKSAQTAAVAAVEGAIPAPSGANPPVGALVSVQPGTGAVVAYYGGRTAGGLDFASGGNGVQPGSSMKPYVLATALEEGKSLTTRYDGSSPQDICGQKHVTNDEGDPAFGRINLSTGLQYSVNTVYVRLACDVGPKRVADLAHAAGIPETDRLDGENGPSQQIALGSGGYEVHVIDQATGFATFAAGGTRARPYFVSSIKDAKGKVLYRARPDTASAFSAAVAADATYAMQRVVQAGTATRAQLADGRPSAGKTGTTGNNANAWFCGFTPQLSTAVWVGRQKGGPLKGVLGSTGGVYGGTVPASIFRSYMDAALQGQPVKDFPPRAYVGGGQDPSPDTTTSAPSPAPSSAPPATAPPTATAAPSPSTAASPSSVPVPTRTPVRPGPTAAPVVPATKPPSPAAAAVASSAPLVVPAG